MPTTRTEPDASDAVRRAIRAIVGYTLGDLAVTLRVARSTLEKYGLGERNAPAPVRRKLAALLRAHAAECAALAGELEAATPTASRSGAVATGV